MLPLSFLLVLLGARPAEVLPLNPDDLKKSPLDDYGRNKFASELYLKEMYRSEGFPATIIMPGQISGPGWTIMNPWANKTPVPFQKIADGEEIMLPNFGMETLHHVHGYDVAQCFFKAISHRNQRWERALMRKRRVHHVIWVCKMMYEFLIKKLG